MVERLEAALAWLEALSTVEVFLGLILVVLFVGLRSIEGKLGEIMTTLWSVRDSVDDIKSAVEPEPDIDDWPPRP